MDVLGEWVPLAGKKCDCSKSGLKCFYDETCPGLGCGAEGKTNCRFCGSGEFADCPAPQTSEPKEDKAPHEAPPKKEKKEKANKPSTDTPSLILGDHKTKLPHAGPVLRWQRNATDLRPKMEGRAGLMLRGFWLGEASYPVAK